MTHTALFPKWTNSIPTVGAVGGVSTLIVVVAVVWYWFTPSFWEVGYMPTQPVAFSHQLHAGTLAMDCRYCHTNVEESKHANIPATSTCMNCHTVVNETTGYLAKAVSLDGVSPSVHWANEGLAILRESHAAELPVPWRRVHKLPDYVQFNHAAHLNAGVSCYSCHQRIDTMPVVFQSQSLAMGWCLECHRAPEKHLVDTKGLLAGGETVRITDLPTIEKLLTDSSAQLERGEELVDKRLWNDPPQNCSACHY